MAQRIILFTNPGCGTCRAEKAWLTQKGIDFQEYSLEDVDVQEELRNLEQRVKRRFQAVPITVIAGQVYEGFDPAMFEQLLAE
jgi:glutaredoxin